jgi:glycosyltransferase involved in cell wall biosynthesis
MERSRIGIVIPALNEAQSIGGVVQEAAAYGLPIVVDDGSRDATGSIARSAGAEVVQHEANRGYDEALNSGCARAVAMGCSYIITMDADGQHNPSLLAQYLEALRGGADLVTGVRDKTQRISEQLFSLVTRLRWGVQDPLCGMKAYTSDLYLEVGHFDSYQSIGTELLLYAARRGRRITQIPVKTRERIGSPRFGRVLSANWRIFRAMYLGMFRSGTR